MPYKEEHFQKGWSIELSCNEDRGTKWFRNRSYPKTFGGKKEHLYLNIKDSDMKELYKCPKFKEIVSDTFIEDLILGKFPKGWKTPKQLEEEIKKFPNQIQPEN